jgi:hypothetical protein
LFALGRLLGAFTWVDSGGAVRVVACAHTSRGLIVLSGAASANQLAGTIALHARVGRQRSGGTAGRPAPLEGRIMPAMTDDMEDLRAEQKRIAAMPGRVAWVKLARLSRTAKIFRGNATALLEHLKRMDDLGYMLPTTSDQRSFEEFLDETERHLHNYVAATQSRVDHFRRFKREDMPEGFREEYQRRIDEEFDTSPLHNFVTDLRNLILHVRLPVSTTEETWERGSAWTFRVLVDSADLLRWDGWNPRAREYIEGSGKSVDLRRAVRALLRCAKPGHAEAATSARDQIAKASSSNATANRRPAGSSTASS